METESRSLHHVDYRGTDKDPSGGGRAITLDESFWQACRDQFPALQRRVGDAPAVFFDVDEIEGINREFKVMRNDKNQGFSRHKIQGPKVLRLLGVKRRRLKAVLFARQFVRLTFKIAVTFSLL